MILYKEIQDVYGREILDSRGNPTVEVEVLVKGGIIGRAAVPSGASTGKFEAVELRDGEKRYLGKGVSQAVHNVNSILADAVIGENVFLQSRIDDILIRVDGTKNKANLGANALLGVSLAVANAASKALNIPLYRYLGGIHGNVMPKPMMNLLNGGRHADNTVDLQEFMIIPTSARTFAIGLQRCAEVYHELKRIVKEKGLSTAVGDEGGFAPDVADSRAVLSLLMDSVHAAGYEPGKDFHFAIDAAASELYQSDGGMYYFPGESKMQGEQIMRSTDEMICYYERLIEEFPICSIEDGLQEDDWDGWKKMTEKLGKKIQLVGDDLFVTNPERLKKGIELQAANAILVKVNQIGTLTEALRAIDIAQKAGYKTIVSHRSGETEDTSIADIAVATGAGQIKTGAPCRSERVAKYNQLLRIEEEVDNS